MRVIEGDCRAVLAEMPADSIDSIVTDPPYHLTSMVRRLSRTNPAEVEKNFTKTVAGQATNPYAAMARGFMGKAWDGGDVAFHPDTWRAVYRVLKPGAHLLAFSGTRTSHRMVCAIEDAGFEIRDTLCWIYGSGFPKSADISKHIDRAAGAERDVVGKSARHNSRAFGEHVGDADYGRFAGGVPDITAPATPEAAQWSGWGTALKPSYEIVTCAQKPYDLGQLCGILAQRLVSAICQLPSYVRAADASSQLSQSVFVEGFGSAQWSAVAACNTPADLYALMDTWPSESALPSSLSIALSWLDTLGVIWTERSTFTIETASSLTTDLRTLNSYPSLITPENIIPAAISQHGIGSNACIAARIFSAVALRLEITHALSVLEPATSQVRPSHEPIVLARKPLRERTVAANVLRHGTGAINIDASRVPHVTVNDGNLADNPHLRSHINGGNGGHIISHEDERRVVTPHQMGRYPANLVHDGSDEVEAAFAAFGTSTSPDVGTRPAHRRHDPTNWQRKSGDAGTESFNGFGDTGSASRFFYSAKATAADRADSRHPTVKPIALLQWLVRLITPPGGTVLDPFAGSGTTAEACMLEGFDAILIEQSAEHVADIRHRMARWSGGDMPLFAPVPAPPEDARIEDLFREPEATTLGG